MPTCDSCNKTIKNGLEIKHWICEDCKVEKSKVDEDQEQKNK